MFRSGTPTSGGATHVIVDDAGMTGGLDLDVSASVTALSKTD